MRSEIRPPIGVGLRIAAIGVAPDDIICSVHDAVVIVVAGESGASGDGTQGRIESVAVTVGVGGERHRNFQVERTGDAGKVRAKVNGGSTEVSIRCGQCGERLINHQRVLFEHLQCQ